MLLFFCLCGFVCCIYSLEIIKLADSALLVFIFLFYQIVLSLWLFLEDRTLIPRVNHWAYTPSSWENFIQFADQGMLFKGQNSYCYQCNFVVTISYLYDFRVGGDLRYKLTYHRNFVQRILRQESKQFLSPVSKSTVLVTTLCCLPLGIKCFAF